jgi:hypothetical protein
MVAESLRIRAIAQLAAKVVYSSTEGSVRVRDIASGVAPLAGIPRAREKEVSTALNMLAAQGVARSVQGGRWALTKEGRRTVDGALARSRERIDSIIDRHFPRTIPDDGLRQWFRDTCIDFFEKYGNFWVNSICNSPKASSIPSGNWKATVSAMARKHDIEEHVQVLTEGFGQFLHGVDRGDQDHMWSLGQAMFAARLLASSVGADPMTTQALRHSRVFLDTNVLIGASLGAGNAARSLDPLADSLGNMDLTLEVLPITRDEYGRVIFEERSQALRVVANFSDEVVGKARGSFIETARGRGCKTLEDFERFFDDVARLPTVLGSEPIQVIEDDEIAFAAEEGSADELLKEQVAGATASARRIPKTENAVTHDAALLNVVEKGTSVGKHYWVLTHDRNMSVLSTRRSGPSGLPSWITVDTLVQVLAVDDAGPSTTAGSFGSLFANIIENEAQPSADTYTVQDLAWLLDVEERCTELPEDGIAECSKIIARA